jgi:hypothetical protein
MLLKPHRAHGAKGAGIRYERKAKVLHQRQYGHHFFEGPWLAFHTDTSAPRRFCQPDALYISLEHAYILVFEYKLQHTDYAWWQLNHLYIPVLEIMFPHSKIVGVEVCKWFDGHIRTSAPVQLVRSPLDAIGFDTNSGWPDFFCHIMKA